MTKPDSGVEAAAEVNEVQMEMVATAKIDIILTALFVIIPIQQMPDTHKR